MLQNRLAAPSCFCFQLILRKGHAAILHICGSHVLLLFLSNLDGNGSLPHQRKPCTGMGSLCGAAAQPRQVSMGFGSLGHICIYIYSYWAHRSSSYHYRPWSTSQQPAPRFTLAAGGPKPSNVTQKELNIAPVLVLAAGNLFISKPDLIPWSNQCPCTWQKGHPDRQVRKHAGKQLSLSSSTARPQQALLPLGAQAVLSTQMRWLPSASAASCSAQHRCLPAALLLAGTEPEPNRRPGLWQGPGWCLGLDATLSSPGAPCPQ